MSREIIFRGRLCHTHEWVFGSLVNLGINKVHIIQADSDDLVEDGHHLRQDSDRPTWVEPSTVGQWSGLYDIQGERIYEGDVLRFEDNHGTWQDVVVFERGVFGLSTLYKKQIKNPDNWDYPHDCINSRGWGIEWGYEEWGTAFTYRKPISQASIFHGEYKDYNGSPMDEWHKKHGYGKNVVWATIIGNRYDNPSLLF